MDIRDIKKLVKEGENESTEFKKKANFPEKIVKEIVAFANTRGGSLLIGVDDDGSISGTKNVEEDLYALENAISIYCFPKVNYTVNVVRVSDKRAVLNYTIFESSKKPHFVYHNGSNSKIKHRTSRKSYVRIRDRSVQASRELIEILKKKDRKNGIKVQFGEKEKILMNYLGKHPSITIKKFSEIAGIRKFIASKTLVWLVLANILEIEAREDEDLFRQKNTGDFL